MTFKYVIYGGEKPKFGGAENLGFRLTRYTGEVGKGDAYTVGGATLDELAKEARIHFPEAKRSRAGDWSSIEASRKAGDWVSMEGPEKAKNVIRMQVGIDVIRDFRKLLR